MATNQLKKLMAVTLPRLMFDPALDQEALSESNTLEEIVCLEVTRQAHATLEKTSLSHFADIGEKG